MAAIFHSLNEVLQIFLLTFNFFLSLRKNPGIAAKTKKETGDLMWVRILKNLIDIFSYQKKTSPKVI